MDIKQKMDELNKQISEAINCSEMLIGRKKYFEAWWQNRYSEWQSNLTALALDLEQCDAVSKLYGNQAERLLSMLNNPNEVISLKTMCEQARWFKYHGNKERKWIIRDVPSIIREKAKDKGKGKYRDVRCPYCSGSIILREQHGPEGNQDHFAHTSIADAKQCLCGEAFEGDEHKMSSDPII